MANENGRVKNGSNGTKRSLLVAIISAIVGGAGGPFLLIKFNPDAIRPDPFTGTQGRFLERRIEILERHLDNHPDVALREAISALRAENATAKAERVQIIKNQDRIMQRLDRLNE